MASSSSFSSVPRSQTDEDKGALLPLSSIRTEREKKKGLPVEIRDAEYLQIRRRLAHQMFLMEIADRKARSESVPLDEHQKRLLSREEEKRAAMRYKREYELMSRFPTWKFYTDMKDGLQLYRVLSPAINTTTIKDPLVVISAATIQAGSAIVVSGDDIKAVENDWTETQKFQLTHNYLKIGHSHRPEQRAEIRRLQNLFFDPCGGWADLIVDKSK